ncbi:DNA recombination protein RmuC [Jannaschia sp. LMIT008]|uniref:DNA recombination protein RmuC n=1 Tax=Jannaschia maritima TaxID=3032585 RepID=UPI002810C959|nr:DNA recombination protein RmuC [Jannaschia sp. LMIT008]
MPDPLILAIVGWAAAIVLLGLWFSARAHLPRANAAEGALADARRKADADDAELRRLTGEAGGLREGTSRLEAQIESLRQERLQADDRARAERADLSAKLDAARAQVEDLKVRNEGLDQALIARAKQHDDEVALLTQIRDDMTDRFKALADDTLKVHGERFGALNRERMDALIGPMRQQVDQFQTELRAAHTGAKADRAALKAEIDGLSRRSEQVSKEAVALTNALKGEKQKQGAWGEMILERVLQDSGLREGSEYRTQFSVTDADGQRRRPDVVVDLPGGKAVVIDSKVSLNAYESAVNAETEDDRTRYMRAHVQAIHRHIDDLQARDYSGMVDGAVDYTVMFLPVEGALAAALEHDPRLSGNAMAKGVTIATPTTLMMALRTVHHVWTIERRESNAAEIAKRAGLMFDKMAGVVEAFEKVGAHLSSAQKSHGDAFDRLKYGNGNLIGQFDELRKLGARTKKAMPVTFDPTDDTPDAPRIEAAE